MVPSSIFTGSESERARRGRRSTSRNPTSRPHFSAAVSNWRMAMRNEFRSSTGFTGIRAVAMVISFRFEGTDSGCAVVELHLVQAQFFAAPDLGMRMAAFRAGTVGPGSLEVASAVLAVMAEGQHFGEERGTLGYRAGSHVGEDVAQTFQGRRRDDRQRPGGLA